MIRQIAKKIKRERHKHLYCNKRSAAQVWANLANILNQRYSLFRLINVKILSEKVILPVLAGIIQSIGSWYNHRNCLFYRCCLPSTRFLNKLLF